jgi:hypothetical protein
MTKHESIAAIPEELLIEHLIEKQPWRYHSVRLSLADMEILIAALYTRL